MIKTIIDKDVNKVELIDLGENGWYILDLNEPKDRWFIRNEAVTQLYEALKAVTGKRGVSDNGARIIQLHRNLVEEKHSNLMFNKGMWWASSHLLRHRSNIKEQTFTRTVKDLCARIILLVHKADGMNQTRWYAINEEHLKTGWK
jgi:hypothetical protein